MPFFSRHADPARLTIYFANLLISFHYFIIIYVNSAFLSQYTDTQHLSFLYIIGSIASVLLFSAFAHLIRRVGNYHLALFFSTLEVLALSGLALGHTADIIIASFILHLAVSPIIYLNLDIFLEALTRNEKITGGVRGIFLTMQNIAQVTCPLLVGLLLAGTAYGRIYLISIGFLLAGMYLLTRLRAYNDVRRHPRTLRYSITYVLKHPVLCHVVVAQFLLRFFYAWMVIYMPLYLFHYAGFSWLTIGTMLAIMVLPFLLLEFPLGKLADSRFGEKRIMVFGFITIAMATASIPLLPPAFILWAIVLFMSRVGAACVEITTESYFFRHIDDAHADTISLFRVARPATYVAAAGIAALSLQVASLRWSFLILAAIMLWGVPHALAVRDTR